MKKSTIILLLLTFCLGIAGCGGGGDSSSVKLSGKAKTSLKTSGLITSGLITSLDVVIAIPFGVTVEVDPQTNEPSKSVVQLAGNFDPKMILTALKYTPATSSTKGSLSITYLNGAGFNPTDYLNIQLDIANGYFPSAADFSLTKFEYSSITVDSVTGAIIDSIVATPVLNPAFTVTIQ